MGCIIWFADDVNSILARNTFMKCWMLVGKFPDFTRFYLQFFEPDTEEIHFVVDVESVYDPSRHLAWFYWPFVILFRNRAVPNSSGDPTFTTEIIGFAMAFCTIRGQSGRHICPFRVAKRGDSDRLEMQKFVILQCDDTLLIKVAPRGWIGGAWILPQRLLNWSLKSVWIFPESRSIVDKKYRHNLNKTKPKNIKLTDRNDELRRYCRNSLAFSRPSQITRRCKLRFFFFFTKLNI